jgi:hypothetical protein
MLLSKHFELAEFVVSETAARQGIDNQPSDQVIANLSGLCEKLLEPLRVHLARPVIITSGYRSIELNQLIGGSNTSQHMTGKAADIIVPGITPFDLCTLIESMNLPYGQLINEFGRWTHISLKTSSKPQQTLTAYRDNNQTIYEAGLINV